MRVSIRNKLAGLCFALLFGVVLTLTAFFSTRDVRRIRGELAAKATAYGMLLSRQAEPAVAFDDEQTARELLEATVQDKDVRTIALYATDGHVIASVGDPPAPPDHDIADIETVVTTTRIGCIAPVVSREGVAGVLVLEMSVDSIAAARRRTIVSSAIAGGIALVLGLGGAWLIGIALTVRLRRVQGAAQRVASGDLTAPPIVDASSDEIGLLARDFNTMKDALRAQLHTIEEAARSEQQRLDALVTERTRELAQKNRDMRLLLDNARQGFLTVDRNGTIVGERSRVLDTWFGERLASGNLRDALESADPGKGDAFMVALSALHDDLLPRELLLEQFPREIRAGARQLSLECQVLDDEPGSPVLVMLSDATDEIERRRAEASQRDLSALCARIVADESAVSEFVVEAEALKLRIAEARADTCAAEAAGDVVLKRNIHTLKGNAALLGFSALADACHDLESRLEAGEGDSDGAFDAVDVAAREIINRAHVLMGAKTAGVELSHAEADALAAAISSGAPRADVARYVARLRLEPVQRRLKRFAEQSEALAHRLSKQVNVRVEANEVRLDAARWAPFWSSFVHVLRNAVDHGIESPEDREACGKAPAGSLVIRAADTETHHVIEVTDDGAGIDFDALERKARERGVTASREELLFCDGVSAKEEVTELSGRGVGLGAARAACAALGGTVQVETRRGQGTTFRFAVPMRGLAQGSLRPVHLAHPGSTNRTTGRSGSEGAHLAYRSHKE